MKQTTSTVLFDRIEKKIKIPQGAVAYNGKIQKNVAIDQLFFEEQRVPLLGKFIFYGTFDRNYYYWQSPISDRVGIEYVIDGSLLVRQSGKILRIEPGEVYLIMPDTEVTLVTGPEGFCHKYAMPITGSLVSTLLTSFNINNENIFHGEFDHNTLKYLLEQIRKSGYLSQENNSLLCYQIMLLLATGAKNKRSPSRLDSVRQMMIQEHSHPFTIAELAKIAGCSESSFTQNFRRDYGQSPYQFLKNIRMQNAAKLLVENPDLLIKEIAVKVGYSDALNFSTAFLSVHHVSPRQYRRDQIQFWGCRNITLYDSHIK